MHRDLPVASGDFHFRVQRIHAGFRRQHGGKTHGGIAAELSAHHLQTAGTAFAFHEGHLLQRTVPVQDAAGRFCLIIPLHGRGHQHGAVSRWIECLVRDIKGFHRL